MLVAKRAGYSVRGADHGPKAMGTYRREIVAAVCAFKLVNEETKIGDTTRPYTCERMIVGMNKMKDPDFQDPHGTPNNRQNELEAAIGCEVHAFRKELDMTVAELACVADLSAGMLSKIERGVGGKGKASLDLPRTTHLDLCHGCGDGRGMELGVGKELSQ